MEESEKKLSVMDIFCAVILIIMFAVVLAQIISRYVFNNVIVWSDELAKFLLIYVAIFGAVVAEERGSNVRFEFIIARLPRIPKLIVSIIMNAIVVTFYILTIIYSTRLSIEAHFMQGVALPMIRWSYIYACVPISFAILLFMHVKKMVFEIKCTLYPKEAISSDKAISTDSDDKKKR